MIRYDALSFALFRLCTPEYLSLTDSIPLHKFA